MRPSWPRARRRRRTPIRSRRWSQRPRHRRRCRRLSADRSRGRRRSLRQIRRSAPPATVGGAFFVLRGKHERQDRQPEDRPCRTRCARPPKGLDVPALPAAQGEGPGFAIAVETPLSAPDMDVSDLRVAIFSGNYNYVRDGANQALNRLADYLLRQGAAVRVYSPTTKTPAFAPKGDLVSPPRRPDPRAARNIGSGR